MGICSSRRRKEPQAKKFKPILNNFETLQEVQNALRRAGLEACQLIIGIDFTKSNSWTGNQSFGGNCLHAVNGTPNPYEEVLFIIARTLDGFDDDHLIPCYGFGDVTTQGSSVFSFNRGNIPSKGLNTLSERYRQLVEFVDLSGPTSFGPLIRQAIKDVRESGMTFHLLLIIADGQVSSNCFQDTANAIVEASQFPLAIVMVGVGDGPWDSMKHFDDSLLQRSWDNFQFVSFTQLMRNPNFSSQERRESSFALNALMELPEQYKICQNMIGNVHNGHGSLPQNGHSQLVVRDPPDASKMAGMLSPENNIPHNTPENYANIF